jgi:hypothetical protein
MDYPPRESPFHPITGYKPMCDYVRDRLRVDKNCDVAAGRDLSDDVISTIGAVLFALRKWFETSEGGLWLFRLQGIEEIQPHVGFDYIMCTPLVGDQIETRPLNPSGKVSNLVIYTRNLHDQARDVPRAMVEAMRKTIFQHNDRVPTMDFTHYVLDHARDWLMSPDGFRWCASQTGYDTKLKVFHALDYYGLRSYRVTENNGTSFWIGPKIDGKPQKSWVVYQPKPVRVCEGCNNEFPCIQTSKYTGPLCCACFAQQSRDSADVLDLCSYRECGEPFNCQNHLSIVQVRNLQKRWRHAVDAELG